LRNLGLFCILYLASCILFSLPAYAEEPAEGYETEEEITAEYVYEEVKIPKIEPAVKLKAGYGIVDEEGSGKAGEFNYLHSSLMGSFKLTAYPLPHRIELEYEGLNLKDFYSDIAYAYKDIFLSRLISTGLYHNLDHYIYPASGGGITYNDENPEAEYGVSVNMHSLFLRFKTPDFPFHLYLDGRLYDKEGSKQQRFLSGYFGNINMVSETRDIDFNSKEFTIGTNSHLGPIEIDLSHYERKFDVNGDSVLYDYFPAAAGRAEDTYPHNLIPEIRESSNTIKIHTSYTGQIVASATLNKGERKNEYSDAKVDYLNAVGELTWMPQHNIAVFLKYRHFDHDIDNPDTVSISGLTDPLNHTYTYAVRPSLSTERDVLSTTLRYRPMNNLTLRAEYSWEEIDRENSDEWNLPDKTNKNTFMLSATAKPLKKLNLKAMYTYKEIDDPAYNYEPDTSNQLRLTATWNTTPELTLFGTYRLAREKGNNERSADRDMIMGNVTYMILKDLSLTTGYAYFRNKVKQDIRYTEMAMGPPPVISSIEDRGVPYKDTANNFYIALGYIKERFNLNGHIGYTISEGEFSPNSTEALQPDSIASFSELKVYETEVSIWGEYEVAKSWWAGLRYEYNDFDDRIDDSYDGKAHMTFITISKRW
jgi:predicted porin